MSKGSVRIALRDEYFCYGCRAFHKFADCPPVKKHPRQYCEGSYKRLAKPTPIPQRSNNK